MHIVCTLSIISIDYFTITLKRQCQQALLMLY